jgi:glycosyltransferase involved in cell wall biosynthesis
MGDIVTDNSFHTLNEVHVLTVGHVVSYKNPDTWIKMAILLKQNMPLVDFRFTWVGDGSLLKTCQDMIKNLGAESYIRFVGRDNSIAKYYEQCDIYVQPSFIESLGLSVLDAMRHGKPCVVANVGGLPELVRDGVNGWVVDAFSAEAMAIKIGLLKNKDLREQMGVEAIKLYQEKFMNRKWKENIWQSHEDVAYMP